MLVSCNFTGRFFLLSGLICLFSFVCSTSVLAKEPAAGKEKQADCEKWISLFDGKTLNGWKKTNFGTEADVIVEDNILIIEMGAPLTGVNMTDKAFKPLPKINYEMKLKAKRQVGGDFFVALTFPINDDFCSLVLGGWGGSVVGLSCLDGYDASENETTDYFPFKNGVWYDIRLVVTKDKIEAWLDKERIIKVDISDKKLSTRIEVELSHPIGLATFQTTAHICDFKMRPLPEKK